MTSQPEKHTIAINMLPNISRSKDKQTIEFGQLIEYNGRNILVKKDTQNGVKKPFPGPLLKNKN